MLFDKILGLKIVVDEHMIISRWVYPTERFWSYEPSRETEKWCRYFGFGHEVREPGAMRTRDTLVVHPKVLAALEKEFK